MQLAEAGIYAFVASARQPLNTCIPTDRSDQVRKTYISEYHNASVGELYGVTKRTSKRQQRAE